MQDFVISRSLSDSRKTHIDQCLQCQYALALAEIRNEIQAYEAWLKDTKAIMAELALNGINAGMVDDEKAKELKENSPIHRLYSIFG